LGSKANFFSCARVTKSELFGVKKLPAKPRDLSANLRIVHRLGPGDLRDLACRPDVPPLVAIAAERLLDARRRPARRAAPGPWISI